jgi:hypothetical protein
VSERELTLSSLHGNRIEYHFWSDEPPMMDGAQMAFVNEDGDILSVRLLRSYVTADTVDFVGQLEDRTLVHGRTIQGEGVFPQAGGHHHRVTAWFLTDWVECQDCYDHNPSCLSCG